jgi:hypothetical protein
VVVQSSGGNTTYKYSTVSFLAPDDMQNTTSSGDIISGSDSWSQLGFIENSDGINIYIQKASGTINPEEISLADETAAKNNNGNVLSTTHGTNPNGIKIYENIHTLTSTSSNDELKYYDMSFNGKDGNTYGIQIFAKSDNQQLSNVNDMVYNSLKD